jgi:hypothetical protein
MSSNTLYLAIIKEISLNIIIYLGSLGTNKLSQLRHWIKRCAERASLV